MQFTDSHIHLQDYKAKNTQQIINQLRQSCFVKVICVSAKTEDFAKVAQLADLAPDLIIPSFGVHPWYINETADNWPELIKKFLAAYPNSMIGECGIDRLKGGNLEQQKFVLQTHIRLANEFGRPLNIHLVHAEDILAQMFKELPTKFLLHSFSGSIPFLNQALQHGAYISLNPSVLRRANADEIIRTIPNNRLLVESDAPFQSDYSSIPEFIKHIADIKGLLPEKTATQIMQNLQNVIKIDK